MLKIKEDRFKFIENSNNIELHNTLTGLFFYINENTKEYIKGNYDISISKIDSFLQEKNFIYDINNFYTNLYPKVTPYSVWNETLYWITDEFLSTTNFDGEFLKLCNGQFTIKEISKNYNIESNEIYYTFDKYVKLNIIKLFNKPYNSSNNVYFRCSKKLESQKFYLIQEAVKSSYKQAKSCFSLII
jgi:hypothetical protein